ncbi:hypothetical protein RHJ63_05515 [Thermosynechococcus sp. JY1334]|uniref:hypothetical protein n=1 Tax=unclassified Thermosynechococcus TaxID=2622553 RepID=UPI0026725098|nr:MULTISPECIES: hypothetical protein [unclassified Thermosynechococcus]MDR7905166.1 hypothetical protein [Thermosynechococcus sp. JY1334]WKT87385.1 hypothetical protein QYC30_05490 [Thermosynechococcus sp. JY1339]WNC56327.1 hypothetical protein RHJ31_05475 [Thermosynechococcus sp. JY1331]
MKVTLELNFGKIQAPPNLLEIAQSVVETGFEKIAELRGYFCPEVLAWLANHCPFGLSTKDEWLKQ